MESIHGDNSKFSRIRRRKQIGFLAPDQQKFAIDPGDAAPLGTAPVECRKLPGFFAAAVIPPDKTGVPVDGKFSIYAALRQHIAIEQAAAGNAAATPDKRNFSHLPEVEPPVPTVGAEQIIIEPKLQKRCTAGSGKRFHQFAAAAVKNIQRRISGSKEPFI